MEDDMPRINVLGVEVSATNMAMTVSAIQSWVEHGKRNYICFATVYGIMECQEDIELLKIYNSSGLTVPDGMPLVWIGWLKGFSYMDRVYGPDLMLKLCKISVDKEFSHFLYGGEQGVAEELKRCLMQNFPGINIVGTYTPPFRELNLHEEEELSRQVAMVKPDIFWVGLSTTKQEKFIKEYLHKLDTKVMLAVGAAFDFHSGRIKEPPQWVKRMGLQWLHRLMTEPRRLWRRYLFNNPLFLLKILRQFMIEIISKISM
jgi:N-acetylglucosaminyldiphosphoundecaprenol N-acetyl-beta-D-mannosaminyltransferase